MADNDRTQQIKSAIRKHLGSVGASRWKIVRAQYPEISEATFWRHVKAVREEAAGAVGPRASALPSREDGTGPVPPVGALPAFYSPLKKAGQYETLLADAETMKQQAMDQRGRITDRVMYERSIVMREKLLREQQQVMAFFQNQETQKQFYDCLIEVICEEAPGVQIKLMEKLQALQEGRLKPRANG